MRPLPSSIARRLNGLGLVAALLGAVSARADIDLQSVPPAQPEAVAMKVFVGESAEIPLTGVSRSGRQLQFLIRRPPAAGRLSAVTPTGRNTATVTYTHDAARGPGLDRFRYAVRAPDGGFSTPADVTLNVVERPPVFVAPARVDFPDVPVGESARQNVEVRNDGGSRLEGTLTVPPPWSLVASDGRYSLGPGGTKTFTINFAPTENLRVTNQGRFSHGTDVELGLSGRGFAPIEIVPREVRLEGDGRSEVRTGGFLVRNVSSDDRELRISAPAQVIVQDSVSVPAHSETQVALHTRAGFLDALDGMLRISGGTVRIEAPLRVMAAPARLLVHPPKIDFGTVAAGRYGRSGLTVRNLGGSPAELRVRLPEGVTLEPDPSYEALAPGTERQFKVSYARPGAAELDDAIEFEVGGIPLPVPVRGIVVERSAGAGAGAGAGEAESSSAAGAIPPRPTNGIPPVEEIGFAQTKSALELTWKRPSPEIVRYELILRTIDFNERGDAFFKYVPLPRVKPRFIRDEVRATLNGLRPGEHVTILLVGYDANGVASAPSPPFVVFMKPRAALQIPWFWISMLALAGFVFVLVNERRKARAASDAEFARMSAR